MSVCETSVQNTMSQYFVDTIMLHIKMATAYNCKIKSEDYDRINDLIILQCKFALEYMKLLRHTRV